MKLLKVLAVLVLLTLAIIPLELRGAPKINIRVGNQTDTDEVWRVRGITFAPSGESFTMNVRYNRRTLSCAVGDIEWITFSDLEQSVGKESGEAPQPKGLNLLGSHQNFPIRVCLPLSYLHLLSE